MSTRPSTISRTASLVGASVLRMCSRSCLSSEIRRRRLLGRPRVDALLELVDLLVDRVEQVDVALGDVVDEVDRRSCPGGSSCSMRVADVARCGSGRTARRSPGVLRTVTIRSAAEDEVDLLVVDDVLLGHGDRDEQEAEDVVAVAPDARAEVRGRPGRRAAQLRPRVGAQRRAERARAAASSSGSSRSVQALPRHSARVLPASARPLLRAGRVRKGSASSDDSSRSASSAAIAPVPAAVTAWRYVWSTTSPAAKTPLMFVSVEPGCTSR